MQIAALPIVISDKDLRLHVAANDLLEALPR